MGHKHDLELIAALVEGRLDDPAEAEALAAACSECGSHRDLLVVLAAVAASPSPTLDDFESRRLRASVWDELATTRAAAPSRGAPWYYRIASVAAVLVLVVGVGVVLGDRSGQDTGITSRDSRQVATYGEADDAMAGAAEQADGETSIEPLSAPEETAAATETTAAADTAFTDEYLDNQFRVSSPEEVEEAVAHFRIRASEFVGSEVAPRAEDCVAADHLAEHPPFLSAAGSVDGVAVDFVALGTADEVAEVVVYRTDDCTVIHREE